MVDARMTNLPDSIWANEGDQRVEYVRADIVTARIDAESEPQWQDGYNSARDDLDADIAHISAREMKLAEIDAHRRKVIAENERLLNALIESNRRIATLEALADEYYARGYGLRRRVVDYLNSTASKQSLRDGFAEWESASGTRFSIAPDKGSARPTEYTRSDLVAELAAENERLQARNLEHEMRLEAEEAKSEYWRSEALSRTGAVKETDVMACPQCEGEGTYADGLDDAACTTTCTRCESNGWIVNLASRPRATSPVDAYETANVSDKPEGQQEPVAWASVKDHLPEVGSKFVLLYDDGSGASLYFRHDSGYIDADGDECDALDENRMWAYLPAGFEFWCEGACEPITLPKWEGPSIPRPSEQAVTEEMVDAAMTAFQERYDRGVSEEELRLVLKAALEAGQ